MSDRDVPDRDVSSVNLAPRVRPVRRVGLKVRYRLVPWWAKVLVIFVLSRVITSNILLQFAAAQEQNAWTGPSPDYFSFASLWDAHWYYIVSVVGYPSELPLTVDGHVAENAWAFMPLYPGLVGLLSAATALPYAVIAVVVSVGFGAASALVFYRLMRLVLPAETALFSVVLFCVAPLSPMMQLAYAESMHQFFLVLALYLLVQRRYWLLVPVVAVMSLTRPSTLAFALALLLHLVQRWLVRGREPFPVPQRVAVIVVGLFTAFMGFLWVLIAAAVTGSPTAYTDTELSWRSAYVGYGELLPFTAWVQGANWWIPKPFGPILLVVVILLFAAVLFTPPVRRLGVDLRFWIASYVLYLLAVFFPQSSTFRLLMPIFPLLGAVAQPRAPLYRVGMVVLFIAGQVGWIYIAWWVDGYDWTPP
ncbi:MAG: hypothetical protein JWQ43_3264 [Glaciihabitans sp.]|nr:hypothetical protein [Glaciihabitans sp.]